MNAIKENVHISTIRSGDYVEHNGQIVTVSSHHIKHDAFMGTTLFGDSYRMGRVPVVKVTPIHIKPAK